MALVPLLDVPVDDPGERSGHPDRVVELELHLGLRHRDDPSDEREDDGGEQCATLHGRLPCWGPGLSLSDPTG